MQMQEVAAAPPPIPPAPIQPSRVGRSGRGRGRGRTAAGARANGGQVTKAGTSAPGIHAEAGGNAAEAASEGQAAGSGCGHTEEGGDAAEAEGEGQEAVGGVGGGEGKAAGGQKQSKRMQR